MPSTDQYPDLLVDGLEVLEELRELDLDSNTFDVTPDTENAKAAVKVSAKLTEEINDNAIAYAIALG